MTGEYEEFVKSIPPVQRAFEGYTGIDDRLDFLGPRIVDLAERVKSLEISGVPMPEAKVEQIPFVRTLAIAGAVGSGATLYEKPAFAGYIKKVRPHWPDGCNHLVDIRVGHGVVQFCPRVGYLALNDTTPDYPFNEFVSDGEEIWVEMRNRSGFIRDITVTVTLSGVM